MSAENLISPVEIKIRSAGKDVIASGSAHTFDDKSLELEIAGLFLEFELLDDNEGQRIEREIKSHTDLKLKIYNFNNSLGTGTATPIYLGVISDRKLYLSFIVHALKKESSKLITYTFFLGEPVNEQ
ncbi:DUF6864 domain-containing function [Pseudomonas fluorescens]